MNERIHPIHKIHALFQNFYFIENTSILVGSLPEKIISEIDGMVDHCTSIMHDDLAYLREHMNAGKNSYQVSVPSPMIEDSYILPFLNHMGEFYVHKFKNLPYPDIFRKVILRKDYGHYDGYNFWINYSYINDINPVHTHGGSLSGVIYVKNETGEETVFPDVNTTYSGKRGDIVMFPSNLRHQVNLKETRNERITIAYNMDYLDNYMSDMNYLG
jgi:hypothetical protein